MEKESFKESILEWANSFIQLSQPNFYRYVRNSGLSVIQMGVLFHLHYRGAGEVTRFCKMMQISAAGASQMISRLEDQGMVVRNGSPENGRVRVVDLTDRGRKIVQEAIQAQQEWVDSLVDDLSMDEMEQISSSINTLKQHMGNIKSQI